jgi:hypothetical protein
MIEPTTSALVIHNPSWRESPALVVTASRIPVHQIRVYGRCNLESNLDRIDVSAHCGLAPAHPREEVGWRTVTINR